MYIKRVVLNDIKGFREVDFSFQRPDGSFNGWTVVTGDNGAGKTVLLKAMAMAIVGPDVVRVLQPSLRGWIREGRESAQIALQLVSDKDVDSVVTGRHHKHPFWAELDIISTAGSEPLLQPADHRRRSKKGPVNGPWAPTTSGWFAAGYGPFRRLRGASPEAQRLMSGPGRVQRFATMFKEDATLEECEHWLKDLNYKKLENRVEEAHLLDTTLKVLNNEFLQNDMRVERVDSDGLWLRDKSMASLNLSDMSEGYRAALAMLTDLIRHVCNAYGSLTLEEQDDGVLAISNPGVVLIDEIDAHLHPKWQRDIGFWLKKRFPNVQFIVTTHSPHICQAADLQGIYYLPSPGGGAPHQLDLIEYNKIIAAKSNEVLLTPAFNMTSTRSPVADDARRRYASLQAKKRAAKLTPDESRELVQLGLFAEDLQELDR